VNKDEKKSITEFDKLRYSDCRFALRFMRSEVGSQSAVCSVQSTGSQSRLPAPGARTAYVRGVHFAIVLVLASLLPCFLASQLSTFPVTDERRRGVACRSGPTRRRRRKTEATRQSPDL